MFDELKLHQEKDRKRATIDLILAIFKAVNAKCHHHLLLIVFFGIQLTKPILKDSDASNETY